MGPFPGKTPYLTTILLSSLCALQLASSTIEKSPIPPQAGSLDNTCVQLPQPEQEQETKQREREEEREGGENGRKVHIPVVGMEEVVEKRMAESVVDKKSDTTAAGPGSGAEEGADVTAPASDEEEEDGHIPERYVVGCGGDRVEAGRRCVCLFCSVVGGERGQNVSKLVFRS